tara:strand:+ start:75 stop:440 length:366 start_codon:yes stop_codon:yes gene_type:complete
MIQENKFKIEKNIPLIKDSRKGSKLTNPLYQLAESMKVGDSVKFLFKEFPGIENKDWDTDKAIEHRRKMYAWESSRNAPKTLRRYLIELYGKSCVAERNLWNIPEEEITTNENGVRVWRIK